MSDILKGHPMMGRPFRPVALGVTILMLAFVAIPVFNLGEHAREGGDVINAVFGVVAAAMLSVGWWTSSLRWAERGLAVAMFAYIFRLVHLLLTEGFSDHVSLAFGVTVIIAGSYVLEANDRRDREWTQ